MTIALIDHCYSILPSGKRQQAVSLLKRSGFMVSLDHIQHDGGKESVFIHFTGSYLELIEVTNQDQFESSCTATELRASKFGYPYALVAATGNIKICENQLKKSYQDIADIRYVIPNMPGWDKAAWAILNTPEHYTPGCYFQFIQYLLRKRSWAEVKCGVNNIYGICGFYFCTNTPSNDREYWYRFLSSIDDCHKSEKNTLSIGIQKLYWLHPEEFYTYFGTKPELSESQGARLSAIKLLSSDIEVSSNYLNSGGFIMTNHTEQDFYTKIDTNLGYALHVVKGNSVFDYVEDINQRLQK
ncbi:hypothetical protein [Xenorhabdus szentirmaii]|uniref:Uncharacterized protein n=1 Tax=Xenorhabdus szentirmaii DSM 16338 TaxID=1427518 RepID=W1IW56_9GAMM|nr:MULTISPECIES: hypothetical protein [Xenorhabdus]MBD2791944.1 hypothetical protein [Xenorhabdus sp. CUL]MBD2820737.1 hypothetical protein [Xenorhabdus sp. 42]MBD2823614.1 hypothetical protein [Xenorhabdus sp. 5]PHM32852.1 hypothetical protein Xsze_03602 [Xenorhabdus szentirmaii DSM 16338]PHM40829.1 hypothetical protein Xszus_00504 [Xenorhabdus szentirmaii]